jgi:hypothetical protein
MNTGKIKQSTRINESTIEHITEYYFKGQLDHTTVMVEEHRLTSVGTILSDLLEAAAMAKDTPLTIEVRHDHANFPKLLVLHYRKKQ